MIGLNHYLVLAGILFAMSPGKAEPFLDEQGNLIEGSSSEKIRVCINGVEQGMFIRSRDVSHPVLLYLHGGMPDYFLTKKYPTDLENHFTVVWWEQRGRIFQYAFRFRRRPDIQHLMSNHDSLLRINWKLKP